MMNRKKIIEDLLQDMHAMRHKLMVGDINKKDVVITPSQGFVLRFVAKNNSVNIKAIAETLHITSSAATQLVSSLVDKKYLIRRNNPNDRRTATIILSEKAKKFFTECEESGLQKMIELFNPLTDKELTQFVALNKKVVDNIINKSKS